MADPVTWYSAALRAAEKLPQNFGTAEQMQRMLEKYGAKQSELKYLKVPEYLSQFGGGRVSKNALADYIGKNVVLPKEVVKSKPSAQSMDDLESAYADLESDLDDAREAGDHIAAEYIRQQQADLMEEMDQIGKGASTRYSDYATYPNSDYKETLVTFPRKQPEASPNNIADWNNFVSGMNQRRRLASVGRRRAYPILPEFEQATDQERQRLAASFPDWWKEFAVGPEEKPLYQSAHWDEPNVLLHYRSSAPDISPTTGEFLNGKYTDKYGNDLPSMPFLEELQSDWGQAGRKKGFKFKTPDEIRSEMEAIFDRGVKLEAGPERDALLAQYNDLKERQLPAAQQGVNVAPLVTNTQDWSAAGIRRFLLDAARQDAPKIAWTTGAQQAARYQGHAPEGMSGYYDKIIPSIINKYVKPYGGKVELAPSLNDLGITKDALDVYPNYALEKQPPHTATLPEALRRKLRDEGIPFFSNGGYVSA